MRISALFLAFALFAPISALAEELPAMPVVNVLEEHFMADDKAVFDLSRLEFRCEFNPAGPWGFCFAGFETRWRQAIELEVEGSGGYSVHDIFSIAALSIDYGSKDGWIERSHFGLGLIQDSRSAHPPSWGVGSAGRLIMRGNLMDAKPEPQRITVDPSKYAPAGWDGRLWIGLMLHNTGPGKSLKVRILNATPPSGILLAGQEAQKGFLQQHLRLISKDASRLKVPAVAEEMKDYAKPALAAQSHEALAKQFQDALQDAEKQALATEKLMELESAYFRWRQSFISTDIDAVNALAAKWRAGGSFGKEIGCIVRAATNLEKIGLRDVTSGRVLGAKTPPISISAARHEYEGFQIVLSALSSTVRKVSVRASDLVGSRATISASNISINPVGYVRIFPGEAGEALVADPLLIGDVPDLKSGENQPIWVTVHVPDNASAGVYSGKIRISSGDGKSLSVPIVLKVRDFSIPKRISLRSSFWMFRDQINRFYHLDEVKFDDYMRWIDLALEHRVCPIDVFEGSCGQLLDITAKSGAASPVNTKPDFTQWDKYVDRMVAGGASTIHLGQSHHQGAFFADAANPIASPGQIARVIENLNVLRDHYKQKGVFDLHYMQLRDETSAPESLNVYKEVQKALPDVKLLLTAPSGEARPHLTIPCPLTPGFDAAWRDEIKAKGGEYWWYVCCAPLGQWANLVLYQTAAQHRALFWQTWDRDIDGLLYWGLNFWTWYQAKWPADVKGPTTRVPAKDDPSFIPVPTAPGDGFSMYPGAAPDKPLSSIRLECIRDGEEDYEYFLMLDSLIAKAEAKGDKSAAVTEARAARAAARKLVGSMTDYEKTGGPYLQVRDRIGDSIEALQKIVTPQKAGD